jgi:hypothetical protein
MCHVYCIPVTNDTVHILKQCDSLRNNHKMLSLIVMYNISDFVYVCLTLSKNSLYDLETSECSLLSTRKLIKTYLG